MMRPIDWLTMAYAVHKSSLIKERLPLSLSVSEESFYRLYLGDIGMFSYQSKINPTTFIDKNSRNALSGVFFENYVADKLMRAGYKLFYWRGKSNLEFEFVIEYDSNIIPIDDKKGEVR